jgi:hypothetical protein
MLICPKCGFENTIVSGNKNLVPWITFILFIILLGDTAFFFREKISFYYEKIKSGRGLAVVLDVDAEKKDSFRSNFEKYLLDRSYFLNAQAVINLHTEDIDNLRKQRESHSAEIENRGCYSKNFGQCVELKSKIISIDSEFQKITEGRKGEHLGWYDDGDQCNADIQRLFEIGSTLNNASSATALVELSSILRKHQEKYSKLMDARNRLDTTQRVSKLERKNDGSFGDRLIQDSIDNAFNLQDEVSGEVDMLNAEITKINDYIGVLNGSLKLEFPLLEKINK